MVDVQSKDVITFDGYEGDYLACPIINIWKDYNDRWGKGLAASIKHGRAMLVKSKSETKLVG